MKPVAEMSEAEFDQAVRGRAWNVAAPPGQAERPATPPASQPTADNTSNPIEPPKPGAIENRNVITMSDAEFDAAVKAKAWLKTG